MEPLYFKVGTMYILGNSKYNYSTTNWILFNGVFMRCSFTELFRIGITIVEITALLFSEYERLD